MTFTRIWQAGAETRTILELPAELTTFGSGTMSLSTSSVKTGTRSFSSTTTSKPRGVTFSSKTSLRSGAFFSNAGIGTGATTMGNLFYLTTTGVRDAYIRLKGSTGNLEMVINGSVVATAGFSASGFVGGNVQQQVGIAYYAHATSGYFTLYLEGASVLTYTGNTGTGATACYIGGNANTTGWTNAATFDDFYIDGSASSETNASPPARYFEFVFPTSNGNYSQFTPSSGSNYQCVDDAGVNDDSDFVSAGSANLLDSYVIQNPTLSGLSILANIAVAYARKTDGAIDSKIAIGFRESSTDAVGADQSLTTNYAVLMERTTVAPDASPWTSTKLNNAELLVKSTGTY